MFGRDRIRGLMAQAVYEELDLRDRETLDRALEKSDTLRAEAEALGALAEMIPREAVELDRDLTLSVRAGIRAEKPVFRPRRAHWVVSSAALAVVLFGVGTMIVLRSPVAIAPEGPRATPSSWPSAGEQSARSPNGRSCGPRPGWQCSAAGRSLGSAAGWRRGGCRPGRRLPRF